MTANQVDGILLVDKPAGMTSHDVVVIARRALGTRRIGHTGTLDPFATGLLVLLVGNATRLLPYVEGEPKVYEATIRFGVETETGDFTGAPVRETPLPERARIHDGISRLTGAIEQVPPAYSAKKVDGIRAHTAARRGRPLDLRPATVVVRQWEVRAQREAELDVSITCGAGTYVRSLARDLGALTGSAAHLTALRRTRSGPFCVDDACDVDDLRAGRVAVLPARLAVPGLPAEQLTDVEAQRVSHGQPVPARSDGVRVALVRDDGSLVAIADREGDAWQPRLVLRTR